MKNSIKMLAFGVSMLIGSTVFAQDDMRYNKTADSTKSDKMIQQKKTGTKYQSDSIQMNKSKMDQKKNVTPSSQPKKDNSDVDPNRMKNSTTPVAPPDTVR